MKTIILIIATTLAAFIHNIAKAELKPVAHLSSKVAVKNYMDAIVNGKTDNIEKLFGENYQAEVQLSTGKKNVIDKKSSIDFLKSNHNLKFQCNASYKILDSNKDCTIAKVEMEFDNFKRVDIVTLTQENEEWKVSKVITTYP